jgi:BirA family biotin operon repressor/biotin-[acetyl-CoA-carboxylase] ligase
MEDLKFNVLKALGEREGFVSGGELASSLGVSRTAIWKTIRSLRGMGYVIDAVPRKGYRLLKAPDTLHPLEIRRRLGTRVFGREIVYYGEVASTNDIAKDLAYKGAPEGTLVVSETQTMGRGRMGRSWFSPKGGLWFSLILRPHLSPGMVPLLALMLGVGVAKALGRVGLGCSLKWPNDVLVDGKKVCGILTELDAEMDVVNHVIAGVGINVNNDVEDFPPEFRHLATTVKRELGGGVSRVELLGHVLHELEEAYFNLVEMGGSVILSEWRRLSSTLGRRVKVVTHGRVLEGLALDVADNGALMLKLESGRIEEVLSGDCLHMEKI